MSDTEREHVPEYWRFRRGLTPIRPRRALWGSEVRCSCGWRMRVNEGRKAAEQYWRAHRREARSVATPGLAP